MRTAANSGRELTKSERLGEEPAPGKVAHHVPRILDLRADLTPGGPQLALAVQTPDRSELLSVLLAKDVGEGATGVVEAVEIYIIKARSDKGNKRCDVPSSKQHDVGVDLAAILELETMTSETLDLSAVLDLDLAVDDLLASTDI